MLYKSNLLTLVTMVDSWYIDGYCSMGPRGCFYSYMYHVIDIETGVVLRVELPVQRRLCLIFVRNVGSLDIHEYFRGLTVSQRTPRFGASQLDIRA